MQCVPGITLAAGVLFGFVEGSNLWALWPPVSLLRQRGWSRWTWSNCRRGDLGRYGWMHEIGGGTWSQCMPLSVHGAYSRLTAVLLGACSYAKWSIFWAITIMYITVYIYIYIYMFYLSFYQSCIPFCYLLFHPFNETCMFNTSYILSFYIHCTDFIWCTCQKWRNKDVQSILWKDSTSQCDTC